uniref:ANF_receptor domain-containing protein n=1 Tax=Heterorhabditis bacteriophora TaxID=37862 RepID=A0A1I7WHF1_HETBA
MVQVGCEVGILPDELDLYGRKTAKVSLDILKRLDHVKNGKYVVVAGIICREYSFVNSVFKISLIIYFIKFSCYAFICGYPRHHTNTSRRGKSITTIGLVQALGAHLNKNVFACVRQPSQGPTFGIKGGYSQNSPNNYFLLDYAHKINKVQQLLENSFSCNEAFKNMHNCKIQKRRLARLGLPAVEDGNDLSESERKQFTRLDFDVNTITWNRVMDTNDRFLRGKMWILKICLIMIGNILKLTTKLHRIYMTFTFGYIRQEGQRLRTPATAPITPPRAFYRPTGIRDTEKMRRIVTRQGNRSSYSMLYHFFSGPLQVGVNNCSF